MKFYCELNEKFIVAEERFDNEKYSIITSSNLTPSGFKRNLEYGVL
ncbi:hypothetical protein JHL18_02395 [Clostridium sp. YIM B02505]|uniref:Phospholipase D-like domain-containing protein n=1 Tax=Clostridium yunnanense TaxID=2800325 RepID=A0ABS1EJF8_9CLOT|nr:hypothetical protein [Clostridium yunnanense]MBK1809495.1 hypothetical protein [Clostridium yunnanense]